MVPGSALGRSCLQTAHCEHGPHWCELLGQSSMVLFMTCVLKMGYFRCCLLSAGSAGFITGLAQTIF